MKVGDITVEEQVFEKTKELLLRDGVKGWTMNDLARECKMSKRTLYKIIGNKEKLLYKLNYESFQSEISRINKYLQSDKPFPVLLNNLSEMIIRSFDDYTINSIQELRTEYPRIKEMDDEEMEKHRDVFIRFFQKGKEEGYLKHDVEPSTVLKIINALVDHYLCNCCDKTEFKKEMDEVLGTVFNGIMK
ncbi:TetR/AcrR family transcriptional regulator [Puteibacter caeruleilacunae]|nr:TetR/AcrR family transcriptional regulator [Puteibacter caeruleilacunae]